jgi:glycosyltransferase involved in cell wall biosynthesis
MGDRALHRILIVFNSDGIGGVERFLSGMVPAFASRAVRVDLVGHGPPPPSPGFLADQHIATLGRGSLPGLLGRIRQGLSLRRRIRGNHYDALIGIGPVACGLVALARRRDSPPVILCERGDPFIERRRTWNRWFGWIYRRADLLVVQTQGLADEIRRRWRLPPAVAVIPNPLPVGVPQLQPAANRPPVIAGVGRLVPSKGYGDLIDAFARLGPQAEGWSLLLVGDGRERASLEARAHDLGLADRVTFAGVHLAPWELLADASIFVLCSRHEGYPNVLLEAMASGCAIVSSDCRFGPLEIVDDGVTGLRYPVGDVDQLTERLERLIADPQQRVALAEAAAAWVGEQTIARAVSAWLDVLTSVRR